MKDFNAVKDNKAQICIGYLCAIIAFVLAVSAIGCMAVVSACEKDARYFSDAAMPVAFVIGLALAAVLSAVSLFIFKKEPLDLSPLSGGYAVVARFSSLLPAVLSLSVTFFALVDESLGEWGNAVLICGAITTLFFALKPFSRFTVLKVLSGFGIFALGAVIIASLYLDLTVEINSHFKLLVQFGAAGLLFGTMADIRLILSPKAPEGFDLPDRDFIKIGVRGFVFLKSLALAFCTACASVIILYFAEGNVAFGTHYLIYSLLYSAYAVSTVLELIVTVLSVCNSRI